MAPAGGCKAARLTNDVSGGGILVLADDDAVDLGLNKLCNF